MRSFSNDYPWPALTPESNDFPEGRFNIGVSGAGGMGSDFTFTLESELNCPGIEEQIEVGNARCMLRIDSPGTAYRRLIPANQSGNTDFVVPTQSVTSIIRFTAIVIASAEVRGYRPEGINETYFGSSRFTIGVGSILAVSNTEVIYLDSELDKRSSSIAYISLDKEQHDPIRAYFEQDRINISLNEGTFEKYKILRNDPSTRRYIVGLITYPIIIDALYNVRDSQEQYEQYTWYQVLSQRLEGMGGIASLDSEPALAPLANKILDDVISRSLSGLDSLIETDEGDQFEGVL